jgi:hypothetical protein
VSPPTAGDPASPEPGRAECSSNGRLLRRAINVWLVFHIAAIIIAPLSVTPSSSLVQATWGVFRPYLELLFLNHGYHFFAPEPGESTLLAYAAERADGSVVQGRIPDSRTMKPRLLYHRHFMLTEHLRDAPEELGKVCLSSFAERIGEQYGAARVNLTGQIHNLPTMDMVRAGTRLDDPASYENESFGVFECARR